MGGSDSVLPMCPGGRAAGAGCVNTPETVAKRGKEGDIAFLEPVSHDNIRMVQDIHYPPPPPMKYNNK